MRKNHVLAAWREGKQTIGCWLTIDSAYVAESLAHAGFDWVCLDLQHGLLDYTDLRVMLPAISTTGTMPFARVPWNEPYEIMKVLDAGVMGVVIPLVNNAEEAAKAVSACRYPPEGIRSFGPARAAMYGGRGYAQEANHEIACIVMIETGEALANLDEILATPGVDAAYIGPSDLAYAIGMNPIGDNNDPKHVATVERIVEACRRNKVAVGIHTNSLEFTSRWLEQGFNMVTLGSDAAFMRRLAGQELGAARKAASLEPSLKP